MFVFGENKGLIMKASIAFKDPESVSNFTTELVESYYKSSTVYIYAVKWCI